MSNQVEADLAVASEKDIAELNLEFARIPKVILTKGAAGSVLLDGKSEILTTAVPAQVKDATGAGDAYLAGVLYAIATGKELTDAMELGSKWAAMTVETESSIPPNWSEVCRRFGI
jgi:sugar/nucleoside kinase (ribokinase family)